MKQSFCFILTPLNFEGELPFEVIPQHFFRRADSEEIVLIKERLNPYLQPLPLGIFQNPRYEFNLSQENGGREEQLQESAWRYWIISFTGTNAEIQNLSMAAGLLKDEIELGFEFHFLPNGATGFGWHAEFLTSFFQSMKFGQKNGTPIKADDLREISENHAALKQAEQNHPNIHKAVNRFHYLKALPRQSSMLVIGYFSIIEALIAHKPRLHESLDSINHQLQSKLILLAKKFQRKLDYQEFFDGMTEEKIWKRLYSYRSAMAHDTLVNFDSEFKDLKGQSNVLGFLREVVKLLLLFALRDPVFVADLKNC